MARSRNFLPKRREQVNRIENTTKIGQWGQNKCRNYRNIIKLFGKDSIKKPAKCENDWSENNKNDGCDWGFLKWASSPNRIHWWLLTCRNWWICPQPTRLLRFWWRGVRITCEAAFWCSGKTKQAKNTCFSRLYASFETQALEIPIGAILGYAKVRRDEEKSHGTRGFYPLHIWQ